MAKKKKMVYIDESDYVSLKHDGIDPSSYLKFCCRNRKLREVFKDWMYRMGFSKLK